MRLITPSANPIITADDCVDRDIAFVADPFRIAVGDDCYIFAEAWSRSAERGRIAVFRLDADNQVVDWKIVVAEPFHLSYPCVFKDSGNYYMLPEAWESGQLLLYQATAFPWHWARVRTLLELDYADPQLFFHNNTYYIFLNTDPLTNTSTSIFWADSLMGEWHPHPQNPVFRNDPLRARSAGPIIQHAGQIFRFSQDCCLRYGHRVFTTEIVDLSPSTICTRSLGWVELKRPQWARQAFHHLDVFREGDTYYALFDGYT